MVRVANVCSAVNMVMKTLFRGNRPHGGDLRRAARPMQD
jgi:hypothetical protein